MRQFWTTTEIKNALEMRERGLSYRQIALKLGRTIASVSGQLAAHRMANSIRVGA
jgi:transcriptional regulator